MSTLEIDASSPNESSSSSLHRHLSFFDLVSVGVGGTIGSGIFVLCGVIARTYAGPATFVSWAIAGAAASLSGCCYAELAARLPASGSAYAYARTSMGELPAVVVAGCLTLEYLGASAAVARSWAEKAAEAYAGDDDEELSPTAAFWTGTSGGAINPPAFALSTIVTCTLLAGVRESKAATHALTLAKVALVVFMTVGSLVLTKPANLTPLVPPEFGVRGVLRGATSSFFGYLGYDEISCLAGEARDPRRDAPRAVMATLTIVTVLYVLAALGLTGAQPYDEMEGVRGFPGMFEYNGVRWAATLTSAGELLTLPVVVLIGLMAQPRVLHALAEDGLAPPCLGRVDARGNPFHGTLVSGVLMTLVATTVPFERINDTISAGVLVAFCATNSSLLLLRRERLVVSATATTASADPDDRFVETCVGVLNAAALALSVAATHGGGSGVARIVAVAAGTAAAAAAAVGLLCARTTEARVFGGARRRREVEAVVAAAGLPPDDDDDSSSARTTPSLLTDDRGRFRTPWTPLTPCVAVLVNWYLVAQLEPVGIALLLVFLASCVGFWYLYGRHHSVRRRQRSDAAEIFSGHAYKKEDDDDDDHANLVLT